jgi:hypothetical protein
MTPIQFICLVLLCSFTSVVSADLSPYRSYIEVSPQTGAIMSNAGKLSQQVPILMPEADVKIRLHLNDDATIIQAEVNCLFQLKLVKSSKTNEVTFITAFPVSQFRRPYLDLQNFSVTVDGEHPPMVIRKTDATKVSGKVLLVDEKVYGTLPQELSIPPVDQQLKELEVSRAKWEEERQNFIKLNRRIPPSYASIKLADGSRWEYCYLWVSTIKTNQTQRVTVDYNVELTPQPNEPPLVKASGKNSIPPQFYLPNTIPWDFHRKVGSGSFYFFSYILRSGAAWSGPIGREEIELLADKGIDLSRSIISGPQPVKTTANRLLWKIVNQKPTEDLLIAIPEASNIQKDKNLDSGKRK